MTERLFHGWYRLDGHTPVPAAMGERGDISDREVAREEVVPGIEVSTVFLGLDHGHGDGPPVLFETMVFGGEMDECQWRYCTWDEAEAGHGAVVARIKAATRSREAR